MDIDDLSGLPMTKAALTLAVLLTGCAHMPRAETVREALSPQERLRLGEAYEAKGLAKEAERQYRLAAKADERFTPARMALGNLAFRQGRYDDAAEDFRKVLDEDRLHAGAANNLAMVLMAQGEDLAQAERLLRAALIQPGPLEPYVLETLAQLCLRLGRPAKAADAILRALEVARPEDAALRAQLAATKQAVDEASAAHAKGAAGR